MSNNEQFFSCECGGDAVALEKFEDDEVNVKEIFISLYTLGQFHRKPNIFQRISHCWYHLKTGKIHADQIILNYDKAQEMGKWLTENAK